MNRRIRLPRLGLLTVAASSLAGGAAFASSHAVGPSGAQAGHRFAAGTYEGVRVPAWLRIPTLPLKSSRVGWISRDAKAGKVIYVADQSAGAIRIYKQKGTNQQQIGEITAGISGVDGLATDTKKNLYSCNFGNGTVTVYAPGTTTPFETLTGAGSPIDAVVAKDGTVYVANFNSGTNGTVLQYDAGQTSPSQTVVDFGSGSFPRGSPSTRTATCSWPSTRRSTAKCSSGRRVTRARSTSASISVTPAV